MLTEFYWVLLGFHQWSSPSTVSMSSYLRSGSAEWSAMLHLAQRQRRPPPVGHDVGNFTDSPSFVFFSSLSSDQSIKPWTVPHVGRFLFVTWATGSNTFTNGRTFCRSMLANVLFLFLYFFLARAGALRQSNCPPVAYRWSIFVRLCLTVGEFYWVLLGFTGFCWPLDWLMTDINCYTTSDDTHVPTR